MASLILKSEYAHLDSRAHCRFSAVTGWLLNPTKSKYYEEILVK